MRYLKGDIHRLLVEYSTQTYMPKRLKNHKNYLVRYLEDAVMANEIVSSHGA